MLKTGAIQQDEDCTYEQSLAARFTAEAHLCGDPIHYTRALAMQAETSARLGDFEGALSFHYKLRVVYRLEDHSDGICRAYGSDRAAQSISLSALWLVEVGKTKEALETCDKVSRELIPKMDPRNVHNSFIMLFPTLWVMKDNGMSLRAKDLFKEHVLDAFDEHFGKDGSTACLPLFRPIMMLLDLDGNQENDVDELESYLSWALCEENLRFGPFLNNAMASFGRIVDSVSAEICLLLAKRVDSRKEKAILVEQGLFVIQEAIATARRKKSAPCLRWALPVLTDLTELKEHAWLYW